MSRCCQKKGTSAPCRLECGMSSCIEICQVRSMLLKWGSQDANKGIGSYQMWLLLSSIMLPWDGGGMEASALLHKQLCRQNSCWVQGALQSCPRNTAPQSQREAGTQGVISGEWIARLWLWLSAFYNELPLQEEQQKLPVLCCQVNVLSHTDVAEAKNVCGNGIVNFGHLEII